MHNITRDLFIRIDFVLLRVEKSRFWADEGLSQDVIGEGLSYRIQRESNTVCRGGVVEISIVELTQGFICNEMEMELISLNV